MSEIDILSKKETENLQGKLETEYVIQNDVRMRVARFIKRYNSGRISYLQGDIYLTTNTAGTVAVGLPLMIALWEHNEDFDLLDVYSFTKNGDCLAHSYAKTKFSQQIGETQRDTDIGRLKGYSELFRQALDQMDAEPEIMTHTAIMNLFYS